MGLTAQRDETLRKVLAIVKVRVKGDLYLLAKALVWNTGLSAESIAGILEEVDAEMGQGKAIDDAVGKLPDQKHLDSAVRLTVLAELNRLISNDENERHDEGGGGMSPR